MILWIIFEDSLPLKTASTQCVTAHCNYSANLTILNPLGLTLGSLTLFLIPHGLWTVLCQSFYKSKATPFMYIDISVTVIFPLIFGLEKMVLPLLKSSFFLLFSRTSCLIDDPWSACKTSCAEENMLACSFSYSSVWKATSLDTTMLAKSATKNSGKVRKAVIYNVSYNICSSYCLIFPLRFWD